MSRTRSKNQTVNAVKAAPGAPLDIVARLLAAATPAGFRTEPFGEIEGCPLLAFTRRAAGVRPRIYLSGGIHGDEPATTETFVHLLAAGVFDDRATWFLCPLLNPAGLARGTRENADNIDLNRDYRWLRSAETRAHVAWLARQPLFDLCLCLHEDWESTGFYLYELNPESRPSLADTLIAAAQNVCPIDHSELIDGRASCAGIIRPTVDLLARDDWPEAIYLRKHHTSLSYTLETPSAFPLAQRVATHAAVVQAAITASTRAPHKTPPDPAPAAR